MTLDSKCYYIVIIIFFSICWFFSVNRCVFCAERDTNWYNELVIIVVLLLWMPEQHFFSVNNVSECLSHSMLCRIHQLFVYLCRFSQMNLLSTFLINNNCSSCQGVKRLLQCLYLNKYKKKTLRREDQKRCSLSLSYAHLHTVNPAV